MKTKNMVLVILSIIVFLFIISWNNASAISSSPQTQSSMLYVKPGGTGTCEGSWGNACADLQTALSAAVPGNQIWVAAGTYKPTIDTNREATFQLKSGVTIYGGFAGTETSLAERDLETNSTTLSGDIGIGGDISDNSYHVVTGSGVDDTAILDGFTITGGNANGTDQYTDGGGIYNISGSPALTNVTFSSNNASNWGGGMYNYTSSPSLTNVNFLDNSATWAGGAIYNYYSNPTLTEVSFSSNSSSYAAGGIYNNESSPGLSKVTFSNNTASDHCGGMYNYMSNPELTNVTFSENTAVYNGGGMYNEVSSPTLTNVTFNSNSAEYGGGIYSEISSSPTLANVTFSGNTAADSGGGMYNSSSSPTLTEVIFSNNQAAWGGGMYNYESNPSLSAVTFSGNFGDYGGGGGMFNSGGSPELTEVVFSNNSSSYAGGGMYNDYSSPSLTDVTFSENAGSDYGGGMYNIYSNPTLTNVTFSSNSAIYGGGMYNDLSVPSPSLTNVTLSGNTATYGGGMFNYESSPSLINAILWGNTPNQIINDDANSVPIVSYSVVQSGCPSGANCNNIITDDPLLGPLADNGGFTFTHALHTGSPAIDTGNPDPTICPATDQRGFPRPLDGDGNGIATCDIGAYEYMDYGPVMFAKPGASGDCSSWSTACELRQALSIASPGVQIWAAEGTYNPLTSNPDPREATFQLKSGVTIYGGFAGTETNLEQRDPETNVTLLSGDLAGNDEADFINIAENSFNVVTGSDVDDTAVLDGFTIIGGNANGIYPYSEGGGIYNDSGSPTLINLTISGNFALFGGGMMNENSACPTLTNVIFNQNTVDYYGGGMHNETSDPTLTDVTFSANSAGDGGGMYNYAGSQTLTNVTFDGNTAQTHGGGMYNQNTSQTLSSITFTNNSACDSGGGMHNNMVSQTLTNVTLNNNTANIGGGMYNLISNSTLTDITFSNNTANLDGGGMYNQESSPSLTDVTFSDNHAVNDGGGINNYFNSIPTLTDVTFTNNSAAHSGGGMYNWDSDPILSDLTFNTNSAEFGGGIYNFQSVPSLTNITFSSNTASWAGGGLYNQSSDPTLENVTFSNNIAENSGGAIFNENSSPPLTNVTFSGNSADYGGGIYNYESAPTLTNVTLTLNEAEENGGGIYNDGSVSILMNTILWENTPDQIHNNPSGSAKATYSDIQGGWDGGCNIDQDPLLGPLADNGGLTLTHALGLGSPAIDAGNPDSSLDYDQRNFFRPMDGDADGHPRCDMGAFELGYVIVTNIEGSGSIAKDPDKIEYLLGDEVTLTAIIDQGWIFTGWSGDASGTDNPLTITIDDSKNITANFSPIEYTLVVAVEPLDSGTVTVDPTQVTYHYGDDITLTPTANTGWTFSGWDGDAFGTDNPLTVTIKGDTTVTANFTQDEYTLTVEANPTEGGTVSTDSEQTIFHYGDEVSLTATPNDGWTFDSWSGAEVTENVVTIKGDTIVTAHFLKDEQESHNVYLPLILR